MITRLPRWFLDLAVSSSFFLVVVVARRGQVPPGSPAWIFEVELRAASGTSARLFWTSDGNFAEQQSVRRPIRPGAQVQTLRRSPAAVAGCDSTPPTPQATLVIGRMALRAADGRVLTTFAAEANPRHDIASIADAGETLIVASRRPWVQRVGRVSLLAA